MTTPKLSNSTCHCPRYPVSHLKQDACVTAGHPGAVCGYTEVDVEGYEYPCDKPATGWRWYQDCDHDDCLDVACDWHQNEGGRRMARAEAERDQLRRQVERVEKLRAERDELGQRFPCERGCIAQGTPEQDCSRHGRTPRELWSIIDEIAADRDRAVADLAAASGWRRKVLDVMGYDDTPEYAQELLDYLPAWKHEHDAVDERVEALTAERDQLRLIANVNGDWNLKFMQLERERDQLRRQVAAVRTVHQPIDAAHYAPRFNRIVKVCTGCGTDDGNWQTWPCPTIRALDGAEGGANRG